MSSEQPLGMFPQTRYHEYYQSFQPGDVLVLYTDGATEATSPNGEEFGRTRLVEAVKNKLVTSCVHQSDVLQERGKQEIGPYS